MPVEAIGGGVQGAVLVPADMQVRLGEGNVLDLGVGPDPVEPLAVLAPEALGIGDRAGVHVVVLGAIDVGRPGDGRSEEHTSELQSLMRISYAVFCLKKKINQ